MIDAEEPETEREEEERFGHQFAVVHPQVGIDRSEKPGDEPGTVAEQIADREGDDDNRDGSDDCNDVALRHRRTNLDRLQEREQQYETWGMIRAGQPMAEREVAERLHEPLALIDHLSLAVVVEGVVSKPLASGDQCHPQQADRQGDRGDRRQSPGKSPPGNPTCCRFGDLTDPKVLRHIGHDCGTLQHTDDAFTRTVARRWPWRGRRPNVRRRVRAPLPGPAVPAPRTGCRSTSPRRSGPSVRRGARG